MLNRKDIPLVAALFAIAFALLLNVGSFTEAQSKTANNQVAQSSVAETSSESREAIATEVIAHYTQKLALLTGVLAAVGIATSALTFWQILLVRKEFAITHRPRMRVRFIHGPDPVDDEKSVFQVYLANVGDSVATVKSFTFSAWTEAGGMETASELTPTGKGIESIKVGAGVLLKGIAKDWDGFDTVFSGTIFVLGRMVYEDSTHASRITAFAREKSGVDGRFRVSEKYAVDEYED